MISFKKQNRKYSRTLLKLLFIAVFPVTLCMLSGCDTASQSTPNVTSTPVCNAVTEQSFASHLPVISITTNKGVGDSYRDASMTIYTDGFDEAIAKLNEEPEYSTTKLTAEKAAKNKNVRNDLLSAADKNYNGNIQIKLRGNSTRNRDKHPYTIKLAEKTDLFGMGANKHWVLLANDIDHTQMRNQITLDFARNIGMDYASMSIPVSLEIDGNYVGVYELCEQIRVGKSRIDIYDWDDTFGDTTPLTAEAIGETEVPQTGGFILEADFYAFNSSSVSSLVTAFQQPFYFNTPEKVSKTTELYKYTFDYIQSFEYALHSPDFFYHADDTHYSGKGKNFDWGGSFKWKSTVKEADYNSPRFDGLHYSELFDMDSLINNFFVCEITDNWDSMKNSTFLYKDIDGLAFMGPAWDYDWAYGNINMYNINTDARFEWQTTNEYFTNEQYYQSVQWNRYLIRDPYFCMLLFEKWNSIRNTAVSGLLDEIDYYTDFLATDGAMNDKRWSYTYTKKYYSGRTPENFTRSCKSLKQFAKQRIEWMDKQFADLDTLIGSLGAYTRDSSIVLSYDDMTNMLTLTPSRNDYTDCRIFINGTTRLDVSREALSNGIDISKYLNDGMNMAVVYPVKSNGNYIYAANIPDSPAKSNYICIER